MPSDTDASARDDNWTGRYSDGRSAAGRAVLVTCAADGLTMAGAHGEAGSAVLWPYPDLKPAAPVQPSAGDTLLSSTTEPGATLFVPAPAFAQLLLLRAPHLRAGRERWRVATPWILVFAVVLALVGATFVFDLNPSRAAARLLPDDVRARLGQTVVRSLSGKRKVCDDAAGRKALDTLVARLAAASGSDKSFRVDVVDWGLLNAFAAPGEQIIITRKLIDQAEGPDEVAGVIAHEMGHGIELHPEAGFIRAVGLSTALQLIMGGSGGSVADVGLLLAQLSYTRAAEREADAHALGILRNAEIGAAGLGAFMQRVDAMERDPDREQTTRRTFRQIDILSTHPQPAERAAEILKQASYPATPALSSSDWAALRGICPTEDPDEPKAGASDR